VSRIAIISDVHADLHALADALAQADRLGCDLVLCAGDLVDGGLFPDETIALLQKRAIPCIRGNHDRWRVAERTSDTEGNDGQRFTENASGSGADLAPETLHFLAALPLTWNGTFDGVRVAVRHGTPRSDMDGIYPNEASAADVERWLSDARADVLLVGHTHQPFTMTTLHGGLIANPGALLRSEPDSSPLGLTYNIESKAYELAPMAPGGTFGVLELPSRTFKVIRAADGVEIEIPRLTTGVTDKRGR
jgi:predicted phosphodiesterase